MSLNLRNLALITALFVGLSVDIAAATSPSGVGVTTPGSGTLVSGNLATATGPHTITDSGIDATASVVELNASSIVGALNCDHAYQTKIVKNDSTDVLMATSNIPTGCTIELRTWEIHSFGTPMYVDFNGQSLFAYGMGGHPIKAFNFAGLKEQDYCKFRWTSAQWELRDCSTDVLANSIPTARPLGPNGNVQASYNVSDGGIYIKAFKGFGDMEVWGYTQSVGSDGVFLPLASGTSSSTVHIFLDGKETPGITAVADCGGFICLTVSSPGLVAGVKGKIIVAGLTCFHAANGLHHYVTISSTVLELDTVSSSGLSTTCTGISRTLFPYASATAVTADSYGVLHDSTGQNGAYIGDLTEGASHAFASLTDYYHGCDAVTGALKSNGDGTCQQAVQTDLAGYQLGTVASDITISSQTTLQNAPGLAVAIGASATEKWEFKGTLYFTAANSTMDVKLGWATAPSGATALWGGADLGSNAIPGFGGGGAAFAPQALATITGTVSEGSAAATFGLHVEGIIFGGGTAGTVQFQFAQNTADAGNLVLKAGSFLRATKITN